MIKHLSIQNYALIENLDIHFEEGINIITGETGAGKSILLGALSLVLGHRADANILFDKDKKCIVEGHFDISKYNFENFFSQNELDYENITIVRREIAPNNRSRAFINDTPVNNALLKEFASELIDIHSQHDTLSLMRSDYQMAVLDDFAGNSSSVESYSRFFSSYQKNKKQLIELHETEKKSKADLDYFSFLCNELIEAKLQNGEQEESEKELELLSNAEEIKLKLNNTLNILNNADTNILSLLKEVTFILDALQKYLPEFDELYNRTHTTYVELKDVFEEIEKTELKINFSKERTDALNERLNIIYELQRKHRVTSVTALLDLIDDFSERILKINTIDNDIAALEKAIDKEEKELYNLSQLISQKRSESIPVLKQKITALLNALAMPDSSFEITLQKGLPFKNNGTDSLSFLFSANKGKAPEEIFKVASGGELSRLMLSLKSVISQKKLLPTLIFDEIDTGISGETAVKTANIINRMGQDMQIIAITHLPQIACTGKTHFMVYKTIQNNKTVTEIQKLTYDQRITTIAGMITGNKPSEASIKTATELLNKFNQ